MDIKLFLNEFADKFAAPEDKSEILRSNGFNIDYLDGVFDLVCRCGENNYTYEGGSNGYILKDADYRYLWDNLIAKQSLFMDWLKAHNLEEGDMMFIHGDINLDGTVDIGCTFEFYDKK